MAQGRSGSTLLGETFRQNKEALYFFEPCRAWGQGIFDSSEVHHREIVGHECSQLIRRLVTCEFTKEDSARLAVDQPALKKGSKQLGVLLSAANTRTAQDLAEAHESLVRDCKKSRASVVKSIRADAGVKDIIDGSATDIQVLHLVRDPRAVVNSQAKTFNVTRKYRRYFADTDASPTKHGSAVDGASEVIASRPEEFETMPPSGEERAHVMGLIVCSVYQKQLSSSEGLGSDRYMRVKYEDLATSTQETVQRVYHWSGLGEVPAGVNSWIDEHTTLQGCQDGGGGGEARDCVELTAQKSKSDLYGTKRDAKAMVDLWRTQMPEEEAAAVWEACRDSRIMESFGYEH